MRAYKAKVCIDCSVEFKPTASNQNRCLVCAKECDRKLHLGYTRQWRRAHPEFDKAKSKRWITAHPGEGTITMKAWRLANPERVAALDRKHVAKRRRGMGLVPLNKPFNGADGHHIDIEQVIYMPRKLHRSVYHNHFTGVGMDKINAIAYNFLFKQEVEAALGDKREQLA